MQKKLFEESEGCQQEKPSPNPPSLEITLPFAMPTWNRVLGMQQFQRMRLRHLIHAFVFHSITSGEDWPTQMVCASKQQSTLLLRLEYSQTIRPNKSKKSAISKLKSAKTKKKKPS